MPAIDSQRFCRRIAMPGLYRIAMQNGARAFCCKDDLGKGNIASIVGLIAPNLIQLDNDDGA